MNLKDEIYIGLMSGTSVDGIDAAIVNFQESRCKLLHAEMYPLPANLAKKIKQLCLPGQNEIDQMGQLDVELGNVFAEAALSALSKTEIPRSQVSAIGSHGQTIRHRPNYATPFTLQISDPNTIAQQTGITTIADFRRRDMAAGGQGAPLAPAFHHNMFRSEQKTRVIINIGGIANITWLPQNGESIGFDVGPGNTLMDAWSQIHLLKPYDKNGAWASSGKLDRGLLNALCSHPFLSQNSPKSTGREEFNIDWLQSILNQRGYDLSPQDVQRTLCQFSVTCIGSAIKNLHSNCEIYLCGGGAKNDFLRQTMIEELPNIPIKTTEELGIEPDWVEAAAFAWLAKQTMHHNPGNLVSVTGANTPVILGGIYYA